MKTVKTELEKLETIENEKLQTLQQLKEFEKSQTEKLYNLQNQQLRKVQNEKREKSENKKLEKVNRMEEILKESRINQEQQDALAWWMANSQMGTDQVGKVADPAKENREI